MPLEIPKLSDMRAARGITQAQLAKMVGVSQPRICNLEKRGVAGLGLLTRVIAALEALPVVQETDPETLAAETAKPTGPVNVVDPDGLRATLASLKDTRSSMKPDQPGDPDRDDCDEAD